MNTGYSLFLLLAALTKAIVCYEIGFRYDYDYTTTIQMESSKNNSQSSIDDVFQVTFTIQPLEFNNDNPNLLLNKLEVRG